MATLTAMDAVSVESSRADPLAHEPALDRDAAGAKPPASDVATGAGRNADEAPNLNKLDVGNPDDGIGPDRVDFISPCFAAVDAMPSICNAPLYERF